MDDSIVHVGYEPADGEEMTGQAKFDALMEAMRTIDTQSLVCGIAANVDLPEEGGHRSAVRIFLEHREGFCADVFFPYALAAGAPEFGSSFAQQGTRNIFVI